MKNLEQIKEIIQRYDELIDLVKSKVKIMEKFDKQYHTARGIDDVEFLEKTVSVICDDSYSGFYDSLSFSFPISYLLMTDEDLITTVKKENEIRIENERILKEETKLKEQKEKEEKELKEYNRLKAKFGN